MYIGRLYGRLYGSIGVNGLFFVIPSNFFYKEKAMFEANILLIYIKASAKIYAGLKK
jgi:hypothetical protein